MAPEKRGSCTRGLQSVNGLPTWIGVLLTIGKTGAGGQCQCHFQGRAAAYLLACLVPEKVKEKVVPVTHSSSENWSADCLTKNLPSLHRL